MQLVPGRDYFYCEYCMSFAFPERSADGVVVLGEESNLPCPVCSTGLVSASVARHGVLHCSKCRGILAQQEVFGDIVKYLRTHASGPPEPPQPLDPAELRRRIHCPGCGQLMETHPYYGPGNSVIDTCMRCGVIWLDYGELDVIINAPGRDRRQKSGPRWR